MSPYREPGTRDERPSAVRARTLYNVREIDALLMALFGVVAIVSHCASCAMFREPAPLAAEAAYTGALLRCVDDAKTLAESKACRARVNREWGVVETAADGGR